MNNPHDQQIPPVIAETPAQPGDGDYRVPHANISWEPDGASTSSGRVAIVGCLGLALLLLGPVCIMVWALSNLTH
jgi:hypothetical protein